MPLIRVIYRAAGCDFDYVTREVLDTLIVRDGITHFYRPSERRWVNIRLDPVRGSGGRYQGPERRGMDKKPKPAKKKGFLDARARCSDWLENLWQHVESHSALG